MSETIHDRRRRLTTEAVQALRSDFKAGYTRRHLALKYGISLSNVDAIVTRKTWKTV